MPGEADMPEGADIRHVISDEKVEPDNVPPFVRALTVDYPDEAERLKGAIPEWCKQVNANLGVENVAESILETTDYISRQEEGEFVEGIAREVAELLDSEEKIYFVQHGTDARSGRYFFDQIKNLIPEELRSKIQLESSFFKIFEAGSTPKHFFFVDDAINSGQQASEALGHLAFVAQQAGVSESTSVHVRALRATDSGSERIAGLDSAFPGATWDINAKRMPTVGNALTKNNAESLANHHLLLPSHALPDTTATLGIFYHRLQDNLPAMYTSAENGLFQNTLMQPYPLNN